MKLARNHMGKVAQLLGKELNEPFKVRLEKTEYTVKLTENGLEYKDAGLFERWYETCSLLTPLLTGKAEIL